MHVPPVSKVTVIFPVEVTVSENVTRISIDSPVVYVPFALLEVTLVIVGAVLSKKTDPKPLVTVAPLLPALSL